MRWRGPDGVLVDVIELRGPDDVPRTYYRLHRHGVWVANCATLTELATHVPLADLTEADQ